MTDVSSSARIRERLAQKEEITRDDIRWILSRTDDKDIDGLARLANTVRRETIGDQACIHGILEFSNWCRKNCTYCGIRCANKYVKRYRLSPDAVADLAITSVKVLGYKMLVLQSGEDPAFSTDELVHIIKRIREGSGGLMFLSIGERDRMTYQKLYLAGARGILMRFESSSPDIYHSAHPGASWESRIAHLRFLREIGYIIATGPMLGLPGATVDTYADDIMLIRELGALMVSAGPFIPHAQTPLAGHAPVSERDMQKFLIAARLAMPRARIPVTTAMEYLWGDGFRRTALASGGNAFMLNLTPSDVRAEYDIYPDKNRRTDHLHTKEAFRKVNGIIEENGMRLCLAFGDEFGLTDAEFAFGCGMDSRA